MQDYPRLQHTLGECKYHVVFIPKYRRKVLFAALRKELGAVLRELARQKAGRVEEGQLRPAHVHRLLSIPPKYAVAAVVGYLKGKSAMHIARTSRGRERNFMGESFWARGYFVSTVGGAERTIREYSRNQEQEDIGLDQLKLFK
jgi:putative transposase